MNSRSPLVCGLVLAAMTVASETFLSEGVGVAEPCGGVAFTCAPRSRTSWATVEWQAETSSPCRVSRAFHLIGDGKARRYWFAGPRSPSFIGNGSERAAGDWNGVISSLVVRDAFTDETVSLTDVAFSKRRPDIPGELCLSAAKRPSSLDRVGQTIAIDIGLFNPGTLPVTGMRCTVSGLPQGVTVVDPEKSARVVALKAFDSALHRILLKAEREASFVVQVSFAGGTAPDAAIDVPVKIGPSCGLPRADYVPEPKPLARGKYEIGAFYFCDWVRPEHWMKVWRQEPGRKPALGWYDNRRGEVLDWQIKWAVENGVSYWLVDWYARKGRHGIDYFEQALAKARYRKYMKWALMWCNHMPAGTSAEDAWDWIVDYWISHCFNTPEYMQVDGKPYVSIWDPNALDRDNGGEGGCRRMLEKARAKARAAGYKGIFFQAMNNDDTGTGGGASRLQAKRREQGFDETTIYHYLGTGNKRIGPRETRYADVVSASPVYWETLRLVPGIRALPNLSTGWDDHPWNDTARVADKSPTEFRRLCGLAKRFSDRTGVRRFCLAPLNEWGEGSYAEPNHEFGFGFYEVVRETFFEKPAKGWPLNFTPQDVGLGPYEVPGVVGIVPQEQDRLWR